MKSFTWASLESNSRLTVEDEGLRLRRRPSGPRQPRPQPPGFFRSKDLGLGVALHEDVIVRVAYQALASDVDVVGLSVLSGAHLGLAARTLEALASRGLHDIKVVVGGTIPASDSHALLDLGVAAVFPTGTSIEAVVAGVAGLFDEKGQGS